MLHCLFSCFPSETGFKLAQSQFFIIVDFVYPVSPPSVSLIIRNGLYCQTKFLYYKGKKGELCILIKFYLAIYSTF